MNTKKLFKGFFAAAVSLASLFAIKKFGSFGVTFANAMLNDVDFDSFSSNKTGSNQDDSLEIFTPTGALNNLNPDLNLFSSEIADIETDNQINNKYQFLSIVEEESTEVVLLNKPEMPQKISIVEREVTDSSELSINNISDYVYSIPRIVGLPNGNLLLVWTGLSQNSDLNIYGTIVNQNLENTGQSQFVINSISSGNQRWPDVRVLDDDTIGVCWSSDHFSTNNYNIHARLFSVSGTPKSEQFLVNTYTLDPLQNACNIEPYGNSGNFAISWTGSNQDGDNSGLFLTLFDNRGQKVSSEFRINDDPSGSQYGSYITKLSNGGFVISYSSGQRDGDETGVMAKMYDSNGLATVSSRVVNQQTSGNQWHGKAIEIDNNLLFFVWISILPSSQKYNVVGIITDFSLEPVSSEFQINTVNDLSHYSPEIEKLSDNSFVIAWRTFDPVTNTNQSVMVRRFSKNGTPISEPFQANSNLSFTQIHNPIAASLVNNSTTSYAISWYGTVNNENTINLRSFSDPFVINPLSDFTINKNQPFNYTIPANTFSSSDSLNLSVNTTSPFSFDSSSWTISGTLENPGQYVFLLSASNEFGGSTSTYLNLEVLNQAPEFQNQIPNQIAAYDQEWIFTVPYNAFNHTENDLSTFSASMADGSDLPSWLTFYPFTKSFSGIPTDGDQTNLSLKVTATDPSGSSISSNFNLSLSNTLDAKRTISATGGQEFRVNTYTSNDQYNPSITSLENGNIVITWTSYNQDGSSFGIFARIYSFEGVALTNEFLVNQNTLNAQVESTITSLEKDNFIITWTTNHQTANGFDIYARIYNKSGTAITNEFLVNTYTASDQEDPFITNLANGNFIIAWTSRDQDGSNLGIYAQGFSSSGNRIGNEFLVNSYTQNEQSKPNIAALPNGNFMAVWHSFGQEGDSDAYGIFARLFSDFGVPLGSEFVVNTQTVSYQYLPYVAVLSNGEIVITWAGQDGSAAGIFAQRFSSMGDRLGSEFLVNSYTIHQQNWPAVASLPNGNFVITWHDTVQDGDSLGVYAQLFSSTGTTIGNYFLVNTYTTDSQNGPIVSRLSNGNFVIVWNSNGQDGDGYGIYAKIFTVTESLNYPPYINQTISNQVAAYDQEWIFTIPYETFRDLENDVLIFNASRADGSALPSWLTFYPFTRCFAGIPPSSASSTLELKVTAQDTYGQSTSTIFTVQFEQGIRKFKSSSEFLVNTITADSQNHPAIEGLPNGNFVILWESNQGVSYFDVKGQVYDSTATKIGSEFQANDYVNSYQGRPSIAQLKNGNFVGVWMGNDVEDGSAEGVVAQLFNSSGEKIGNAFLVNTYTYGTQGITYSRAVTCLNNGNFVVTWASNGQDGSENGGYFEIFSSSGEKISGETQINQYTSSQQYYQTIAALTSGGFVVVWDSYGQDGDHRSIVARIYNQHGFPLASEFIVNQYTADGQYHPAVTTLPNGNFVITWASFNQDGSADGIYCSIFSSTGERVVSEFLVNQYTLNNQRFPEVSALSNGDFVIVWDSENRDGSGYAVVGRRFNHVANSFENEFIINDYTTNDQKFVAVSSLPNGDFATTWVSTGQDQSGDGVYAKIFETYLSFYPILNQTIPLKNYTISLGNTNQINFSNALFFDPSGSSISYQSTMANGNSLPSWINFYANPPSYFLSPTKLDLGDYNLRLIAKNTFNQTSNLDFTLSVKNNNPVVNFAPYDQEIFRGKFLNLTLSNTTFTDPDGDALTWYSNVTAPITFYTNNYTFIGYPQVPGSQIIGVNATDGYGGWASTSFNLTVLPRTPYLNGTLSNFEISIPNPTPLNVSQSIFVEPAKGPITLTSLLNNGSSLPSFIHFITTPPSYVFSPKSGDQGSYPVRLHGTNEVGETSYADFDVTVINTAPVKNETIADQYGFIGIALQWKVPAYGFYDADGDSLRYRLVGALNAQSIVACEAAALPSSYWNFNDQTKTLVIDSSIPVGQAGIYKLCLKASDGYTETDSEFGVELFESSTTTVGLSFSPMVNVTTLAVNILEDNGFRFDGFQLYGIGSGQYRVQARSSDNLNKQMSRGVAGVFNTPSYGSVASSYSSGVWSVTGTIDEINEIFKRLMFSPTANSHGRVSINVLIRNVQDTSTLLDRTFYVDVASVPDAPYVKKDESYIVNFENGYQWLLDLDEVFGDDDGDVLRYETLSCEIPGSIPRCSSSLFSHQARKNLIGDFSREWGTGIYNVTIKARDDLNFTTYSILVTTGGTTLPIITLTITATLAPLLLSVLGLVIGCLKKNKKLCFSNRKTAPASTTTSSASPPPLPPAPTSSRSSSSIDTTGGCLPVDSSTEDTCNDGSEFHGRTSTMQNSSQAQLLRSLEEQDNSDLENGDLDLIRPNFVPESGMKQSFETEINQTLQPDVPSVQRITNTIRIPYTDLTLVKLLGRGGFGEVYKGKWIHTDVAIKQLRNDVPVTDDMLEEFEEEAERHASFRHPNIVMLFGVCLEKHHYGMVMELMVKGSLYDLLHNGQTLPWRARLSIAQDVCNGILFLHKQQPPVVHRDLKSLNVLINGSMRAKVSDFGLSKIKTSTVSMSNGPKGTFLWMAPELFDEEGKYTEHSDIYSLGVVLWEIASRQLPHKGCQNQMQLYARVAVKGMRDEIPQDTPALVSKLIARCWAQRREDRPDAEQVVKEIMQVQL